MLDFSINFIPAFAHLSSWKASLAVCVLVRWLKGSMFIFTKPSLVMEADNNLKSTHVSTRMLFMWEGMKLRFPCFLINLILELPYILWSFNLGSLLMG